MKKYDLVVVGSGAGFIVLDAALERGLSCALVEKDQFGGTCLNRGCIPSKMLVYPADLIREAERAPKLGVDLGKPKVDWQRLGERMFEKINMNKYIREEYLDTPNLDVYEGTAAFVDGHTMQVAFKDGTVSPPFTAQRFVLAGGARSRQPQIEGLSAINPVTYETFFGPRFPKKPWKSLTIIGGGIIATEFAHIFSAMGTQVTIIGRAPKIPKSANFWPISTAPLASACCWCIRRSRPKWPAAKSASPPSARRRAGRLTWTARKCWWPPASYQMPTCSTSARPR